MVAQTTLNIGTGLVNNVISPETDDTKVEAP